jgi:N-acyl-D-aspartate/D-glutamate deacylase
MLGQLPSDNHYADQKEITKMVFDLVIQNGEVIDGTGKPRFQADLGLRNGKIEAIAAVGDNVQDIVY